MSLPRRTTSLPRGSISSPSAAMKGRLGANLDPPSSPLSSPPSDPPINRKGNKRKIPHRTNSIIIDNDDGYEAETSAKKLKHIPASKKSGLRKQNKAPLKALPMASTFALSPAHDQMLVSSRDAGVPWPEIRLKWEELTGDATAYSTLPNRYARLKSLFLQIPPTDNPLLLEAKHEIDAEFERGKWEAVGRRMVEKGASRRFEGGDLKRQYEKLMVFGEELRTGGCAEGEGEEGEEGEETEE